MTDHGAVYRGLRSTSDAASTLEMLSSFVGIAIVALPASILTARFMEGIDGKPQNSIDEPCGGNAIDADAQPPQL